MSLAVNSTDPIALYISFEADIGTLQEQYILANANNLEAHPALGISRLVYFVIHFAALLRNTLQETIRPNRGPDGPDLRSVAALQASRRPVLGPRHSDRALRA